MPPRFPPESMIDWKTNCAFGAVPLNDVDGNVLVDGVEPERKPFPTIDPEVCVPCPPPVVWLSSHVDALPSA